MTSQHPVGPDGKQTDTEAVSPGGKGVGPLASQEDPTGSGSERNLPDIRLERRWFLHFVATAILVVGLGLLLHFALFASGIATVSMPADPRADGIVVLTGGADRVDKAIELLSEGRAERLLISGVHPGTTQKQLISLTSADKALFECCIDLDRLALNTVGNAVETSQWVRDNAYETLLVVTSAYHLPRAQLELREMLPDVRFVAYPVYSRDLDLVHWYRHPKTIKLLIREYVKYTVARIRIGFEMVF